MVTAHSAPRLSAPSFAIEMIARLCALVVFPVWRTARLAARLALPSRFPPPWTGDGRSRLFCPVRRRHGDQRSHATPFTAGFDRARLAAAGGAA
jgi:hypothetical protein